MTRAAWLVPARDGGTGTHEPGSGPDQVAPDHELVRRGQQGDLQAFDELMRRHVIRAYHVALAVLHDHHDAQDTAQDAFLAAGFRSVSTPITWRPPLSPGILPGPVPGWGFLPASAAGTASPEPSAAPTATPRCST